MRTYRNLLLVACCCLTVCLFPSAAQADAGESADAAVSAPDATVSAACAAALVSFGPEDPLQMSPCFVSVACADGSTVSCNGNSSCTTSGTNNRCVTCDGAQQGCCALSACEQCDNSYNSCSSTCEFPFECARCDRIYGRCLAHHNCP